MTHSGACWRAELKIACALSALLLNFVAPVEGSLNASRPGRHSELGTSNSSFLSYSPSNFTTVKGRHSVSSTPPQFVFEMYKCLQLQEGEASGLRGKCFSDLDATAPADSDYSSVDVLGGRRKCTILCFIL